MSYEELSSLLPSVAEAFAEARQETHSWVLQDSEEWANIPATLNETRSE